MLRLSSYAVLSESMKHGGYALLSGLTGAVDVVDDILEGILREKTRGADPRFVYFHDGELSEDVRAHWIARGYLTSLTHEEEKENVRTVAEVLHEKLSANQTIVIAPDTDCNYRCVYCFEQHLHTGADPKPAMREEEVEWIYRAVDQINVSFTGKKRIALYGGEPLNAKNRGLVHKIVGMGIDRGYDFNAVTNGHDLDAFLPLLGKGKIADLQITMDGPKSIHDKRRIALDGSSSYDRLTANMRRALSETDVRILVRVNLDESNIGTFGELLESFDNEGWMNGQRFVVNAAVVNVRDDRGGIAPAQALLSVMGKLRKYAHRYGNVEIGSSQAEQGDLVYFALAGNKPHSLRSAFCGAASGMYVFVPGGRIYSCWEAIGTAHGEVGGYGAEGLSVDPTKSAEWFGRNAALIPECLDCRYCLICAGGCPQHAIHNHGTLYKPYCDGFQETYPLVLAEHVDKYLAELRR